MPLRERARARDRPLIVAYAELVNPDGIAGSGDEYYRTLESGRTKIVFGSQDARKDKLDTIFRTALVIKFYVNSQLPHSELPTRVVRTTG